MASFVTLVLIVFRSVYLFPVESPFENGSDRKWLPEKTNYHLGYMEDYLMNATYLNYKEWAKMIF